MDNREYNGWRNYATWNINLWLMNDNPLYDALRKRVGGVRIDWYEAWILVGHVFDQFGMKETRDGVSLDSLDIDWTQIASSINETFAEAA